MVFLDDDAVAEPDWLMRLVAHYNDDHVVGVGGRSIPEWEGPAPGWLPEELYWILGCTYRGYPAEGGDVRNILGNSMSYRSSTLKELRGFRLGRKRFWQVTSGTAEETELCLRIRDQFPGTRIIYEPRAVVRHLVPRSRLRLRYVWRRAVGEGVAKARLRRLHSSRPAVLSHEIGYLRHLVFTFIPQSLRHDGTPARMGAILQVLVVLLVIGATGLGYGWTYLKETLLLLVRRLAPQRGPWSAARHGK